MDIFNGVLQKAFIRENYVSILLLFFPFSYPSSRGGGNDTFIELQPQPLSGRDQPLRVHTFLFLSFDNQFRELSRTTIAHFGLRLYSLINTEIERLVKESLFNFFFQNTNE